MNLIEVKCQQCAFAFSAENAVETMQKALHRSEIKSEINALQNILGLHELGHRRDEIALNGVTLENMHEHLVKEPSHSINVTLRIIE